MSGGGEEVVLDCWGGSWLDGAVWLRNMAGLARDSDFAVGCAAYAGAGLGGAIDVAGRVFSI